MFPMRLMPYSPPLARSLLPFRHQTLICTLSFTLTLTLTLARAPALVPLALALLILREPLLCHGCEQKPDLADSLPGLVVPSHRLPVPSSSELLDRLVQALIDPLRPLLRRIAQGIGPGGFGLALLLLVVAPPSLLGSLQRPVSELVLRDLFFKYISAATLAQVPSSSG
ncbi:hypothetical protein PG988_006654 [Apiospora saccharicola]